MRRVFSALWSLIGLALFALMVTFVVHIVTTDTIALHRLADEEICIGQRSSCHPEYSLLERNALGVSIDYTTPYSRVVQCRRAHVFVGDYACTVVPSLAATEHAPAVAPPSASARRAPAKPSIVVQ
jgi:hypothetical protein